MDYGYRWLSCGASKACYVCKMCGAIRGAETQASLSMGVFGTNERGGGGREERRERVVALLTWTQWTMSELFLHFNLTIHVPPTLLIPTPKVCAAHLRFLVSFCSFKYEPSFLQSLEELSPVVLPNLKGKLKVL